MTDQDSQHFTASSLPEPPVSSAQNIAARLTCLQSQQMVSQFSFFSFISIISVCTIGILYWGESRISHLAIQLWFWLALAAIIGNIAVMRRLHHTLRQRSAKTLELSINMSIPSKAVSTRASNRKLEFRKRAVAVTGIFSTSSVRMMS